MHRYLTNQTADYTATTLSIPLTTSLPFPGDKNQVVHPMDNGPDVVIGISSDNYFDVQAQASYITPTNYRILMDFWYLEAMGAGRRRSFYWEHPTDTKIYTVKFTTVLTPIKTASGHLSIGPFTLRVEGNKP